MKKFAAMVIVALALGGLWLVKGSSSHPSPAQKWEYKFEMCDERLANARGADGWELVSYANHDSGGQVIPLCSFKRPR